MARISSQNLQNQINGSPAVETATPVKKRVVKKSTLPVVEEVKEDPDSNNFKLSTKKLALQTVFDKLAKCSQKTIVVKEIKIEESFDWAKSVRDLREVFESEWSKKTAELDALFRTELKKIRDKTNLKNVPKLLAETIAAIRKEGWVIGRSKNKEVLSKFFSPFFQVDEATKAGTIRKYKKPFCLLKAVHVPYGDQKLGSNIQVELLGVHPNVNNGEMACPGSLSGKEIDFMNADNLTSILKEVELTYRRGHLDSAFNGLSGEYDIIQDSKTKKGDSWC